jgi:hypothetical protein
VKDGQRFGVSVVADDDTVWREFELAHSWVVSVVRCGLELSVAVGSSEL